MEDLDRVTQEEIEEIKRQVKENYWEPFPGVTIVAWQLPNGFTISDQSGCINPANYNRELGIKIARGHLESQLWKLYGFVKAEKRKDAGLKCRD